MKYGWEAVYKWIIYCKFVIPPPPPPTAQLQNSFQDKHVFNQKIFFMCTCLIFKARELHSFTCHWRQDFLKFFGSFWQATDYRKYPKSFYRFLFVSHILQLFQLQWCKHGPKFYPILNFSLLILYTWKYRKYFYENALFEDGKFCYNNLWQYIVKGKISRSHWSQSWFKIKLKAA